MSAKRKALESKKQAQRELEVERMKQQEEKQAQRDLKSQPYDYYLICDVEATCEEGSGFDYENEIIEFPVILIDGQQMKEIDIFHAYVKPSIHPRLSEFCTCLTGIQQETVDNAAPFFTVYQQFKDWLYSKVSSTSECMFVTDGPWDLRDFMEKEFVYHNYHRPDHMKKFIDLRKIFKKHYDRDAGNLNQMLKHLNMTFEGKEHSGIDDARNILRIVYRLAADGCRLEYNTDLKRHKAKRGKWFTMRKPVHSGE